MILIWLGSFAVMLFGMSESQKQISKFTFEWQKNILSKGLETSFSKMLLGSLALVVAEASPQKSLHSGLVLFNLRILGLRASLLQMCLSVLGAWWILLLGFLFLGVNGFFALGLGSLVFLNVGLTEKWKVGLRALFSMGLFLVGGESVFRNSSVLLTTLGQSELAFFLADGRFGSMVLLGLLGIVLSFFVQVEFWSFALGLSFLISSTISINGALGLVVGERIGRMLLFWWRSRVLSLDCQRLVSQLTLSSVAGTLMGLIAVGVLRDLFLVQDKSLFFVAIMMIVLFCQFVGQMTWGHFANKVQSTEAVKAQYILPTWMNEEVLPAGVQAWARGKIQVRLGEIRYHLQGLGSLREDQVPGTLKARLRDEEQQLSKLVF